MINVCNNCHNSFYFFELLGRNDCPVCGCNLDSVGYTRVSEEDDEAV